MVGIPFYIYIFMAPGCAQIDTVGTQIGNIGTWIDILIKIIRGLFDFIPNQWCLDVPGQILMAPG